MHLEACSAFYYDNLQYVLPLGLKSTIYSFLFVCVYIHTYIHIYVYSSTRMTGSSLRHVQQSNGDISPRLQLPGYDAHASSEKFHLALHEFHRDGLKMSVHANSPVRSTGSRSESDIRDTASLCASVGCNLAYACLTLAYHVRHSR